MSVDTGQTSVQHVLYCKILEAFSHGVQCVWVIGGSVISNTLVLELSVKRDALQVANRYRYHSTWSHHSIQMTIEAL